VVLAVAALCGLFGLLLFFCGSSRLQRGSLARATTPRLGLSAMKPVAAAVVRTAQIPVINDKTEVIRLSGDEAPTAVSMSQQGKIAAALLKAGVPSPASWRSEPVAGVDVAASGTRNPPALQTAELKLTGNADSEPPAALKRDSGRAARPNASTKSSGGWMLWTGIALVVLSVYLIAAHFGWL
jgi:hypothetical protein